MCILAELFFFVVYSNVHCSSFCLFSAGDVRVNWAPILKNGVTLKSGDVVSVSGMGRLKVIKKKNVKSYLLSYK